MIIYIRHGNDNYDDPTYRYDRRLTSQGKNDTKSVIQALLKKYGKPKKIFLKARKHVSACTKPRNGNIRLRNIS